MDTSLPILSIPPRPPESMVVDNDVETAGATDSGSTPSRPIATKRALHHDDTSRTSATTLGSTSPGEQQRPVRRRSLSITRICGLGSPTTSLLRRSSTFQERNLAASAGNSRTSNAVAANERPSPMLSPSILSSLDLKDVVGCQDGDERSYMLSKRDSPLPSTSRVGEAAELDSPCFHQSFSSMLSTPSLNTMDRRRLVMQKVVQQAQIRIANRQMLHEMRRVLVQDAKEEPRRSAVDTHATVLKLQALIRGFLGRRQCQRRRERPSLLVLPTPPPSIGDDEASAMGRRRRSSHRREVPADECLEGHQRETTQCCPAPLVTPEEPLRRSRHKACDTSEITMSDFGDSLTSFLFGDSSHHRTHSVVGSPHAVKYQITIPEDACNMSFHSFADILEDNQVQDEDEDELSYEDLNDLLLRHKGEDEDATRNHENGHHSASSLPVWSNPKLQSQHGLPQSSSDHTKKKTNATVQDKNTSWSMETGHMSFSSYFQRSCDTPIRAPKRGVSPPLPKKEAASAGGNMRRSCETATTATVTTIHTGTTFASKSPLTTPDLMMVDMVIPTTDVDRSKSRDTRECHSEVATGKLNNYDEESLGSFPVSSCHVRKSEHNGMSQGTPSTSAFLAQHYASVPNLSSCSQVPPPSFVRPDFPMRRPVRRLTPDPVCPNRTSSASEDEEASHIVTSKSSNSNYSLPDESEDDEVSLGSFRGLLGPEQPPHQPVSQFNMSMPCRISQTKDTPIRRPRRKLTPDPDKLAESPHVAVVSPSIRSRTRRRRTVAVTDQDYRDYDIDIDTDDTENDEPLDYRPRIVRGRAGGREFVPPKSISLPIRRTVYSASAPTNPSRRRCVSPLVLQDGPVKPPERQKSSDLVQ